MTSLERSGDATPGEIEEAFASHLANGLIDIVQDADTGEIEVHADHWTLALQGVPPTLAFFAVDDEPTEAAEMPAAVAEIVGESDLAAFRRLDGSTSGALATALRTSGDPLSIALAERITG